MSKWGLLICEGSHDEEFLLCLSQFMNGWSISTTRPKQVPGSFPLKHPYKYLISNRDTALVIRGLGGVSKVLGEEGQELVRSASLANAIGIIVDADDIGVTSRHQDIISLYSSIVPAAAKSIVGQTVDADQADSDKRRFGVWIAPDCKSNGQLDSVIHDSISTIYPNEVDLADKFINDLGVTHNHKWGQFEEKACLCAVGQLWRAGGSLASAIQERQHWANTTTVVEPKLAGLIDFLDNLLS